MAEETEKYQEISRGHVLFQARLRDASPLLKVLKNGAIKRKLLPSLSRSKDYETRLKDWGTRYVE